MQKSKGSYASIQKYTMRTVGVNYFDPALMKPLPGKTFAPATILPDIASALLIGKRSAREITKHHAEIRNKLCRPAVLCRSTIGNLLDEERTANKLQDDLLKCFSVAKSLRILETYPRTASIVALIDGIDLGQVHEGGAHCELCLERWHQDKVSYFHRVVVLSLVTKYGAFPIFFRFCQMKEITVDPKKASDENLKAEGELTCAKEMLIELAGRFGGRLPFDVVASDALMANAPFMQLVEALGSAGIFIFKQENRILYQQAKQDFCGNTLGFNVLKYSWDKDPSKKGRRFEAQWSTFQDINRRGEDKNVKIFETTRTDLDGTCIKTMAITSDRKFISPELVEIARYEKWRNLENGVFNELTTNWGTLKHIFFHKKNALSSMLALLFLCLVISNLYRFGNLTRGVRRFHGTLRDFFDQMRSTLDAMRRQTLRELRCASP